MKQFTKNIVNWLTTTRLFNFPRKIVGKFILYALFSNKNVEVIFNRDPEKLKALDLIKKIDTEQELLINSIEAYQLFMAVERTAKVNGDIAEVGTYRGGSAKLICEAKGNKALHLFDTFQGLPDLCEYDDPKQFHRGQYSSSFENVKTYLEKYPNVYFYKGFFPSTSGPIKDKRFSLVNLDVDLYKTTLSCLEFFHPRMNTGGVIISHDYIGVPGVKKAFDDFFENKPEPIIQLSGSQCLIVKC